MMARKFIKLADLTPEIYLRYKRKDFEDRQIALLYECSTETLGDWKRANGLIGVSIRNWSTWETYFPDDVKKLKKKYKELWNRGWKREYIAEEMEMSHGALTRFVDRFLPHMKSHTVTLRLTEEQKRIVAENGLKENTVHARIHAGMDIETAIRKPLEQPIGSMSVDIDRTWSDLSDEHKQLAIQNKLTTSTVIRRLKRGWPDELAVTKPPRKRGKGTQK
jgi:hypothetical protein